MASLALGVAAAFAATPEAPELNGPPSATSTEATLFGILDPGQSGEGLETFSYEFLYRESASECAGGSSTAEETSNGEGHQQVFGFLSGLTPGTKYTVCLRAHNGEGANVSAPETFETAVPPQTPETLPATGLTGTTATLHGVLNPAAPGQASETYRFRYAKSATECEGPGGAETAEEPAALSEGEEVSATLGELQPATAYSFCLLARNSAGETAVSAARAFSTTTTAPVVEVETASAAGESSATVEAEINPGGLPSVFHVEYVSEEQFLIGGWAAAQSLPIPDAELPASSVGVKVLLHLTSLAPETSYRFRFVATNGRGEGTGVGASFSTTAPESGQGLPDGRTYELVSTSGSFGEPYEPTYEIESPNRPFWSRQPFRAAANGEAVAYQGGPAQSGGSGRVGNGSGNQWLAVRGANGWSTEVIAPPGDVFATYQAFSPDLKTGFVQSSLQPPLAPGAPSGCGQLLYSRASETGTYSAVLTAESTSPASCGRPMYAGSSADGSQVIFQTEAALTANAQEATELPGGHPTHSGGFGTETGEPCMFGCNLYVEVGGRPQLVNILPGAGQEAVPNASFGGYPGLNGSESDRTNLGNAISTDGSRIFWTATREGPEMEHVYVLEDHEHEVQVSGPGPAEYWAATPDGRYAYYTEAGELWRFDTESNTRELIAGPGSSVVGVIGVNQTGSDGAYLYFVAEGTPLAGNIVENGNGPEEAEVGKPNLYLIHESAPTFIARLSQTDSGVGDASSPGIVADPIGRQEDYGDWVANLGARTAQLSPDGRHLVFQSARPLTGVVSINPSPNPENVKLMSEAFIYDAESEQIACVSCSPSASPPVVGLDVANTTHLPISNETFSYQRRWMSAGGDRVFFETMQPLVYADRNTLLDVYEWEREGTGTCASRPIPRLNRGCTFLISSGARGSGARFVDADSRGENVFFEQRGSLGGAVTVAGANELYDARIGGGFPVVGATQCGLPFCLAEPAGTSAHSTPASTGLSDHGNVAPQRKSRKAQQQKRLSRALKACRAGSPSKQSRKSCEHKARQRYGAKSRQAGGERRSK